MTDFLQMSNWCFLWHCLQCETFMFQLAVKDSNLVLDFVYYRGPSSLNFRLTSE